MFDTFKIRQNIKSVRQRVGAAREIAHCGIPMKPAAKIDRRTERTRSALMNAVIEILLTEGYESVTVERVAERANVGRSTFYMHYSSKDDIVKASLMRPSSHLAVVVGGDLSAAMLVPALMHFHENRKRNRVFLAGRVREIWSACLADMILPRVAVLVRHARARIILPLPMIARQIADAQIALVVNWLIANPTIKPEAIAEALIATTRALLSSLLRCDPDTLLCIPGEKLRSLPA
jgi:AcrR family transcriptional regulator